MNTNSLKLVCALVVSVALSNSARAGLIFEFGQASYFALPNSTVDVDVFLTATGTDRQYLLNTSPGRIFALGVRVNNNQIGTGARVVNAGNVIINTATFDDPLVPAPEVTTSSARAQAFTLNPDGVALPDANPLRVRLATFRYTLGNTVGVTTTLSFADYDPTPNVDNIVASDGVGGSITLDGLVTYSNTATITAVPEPASIVMFLAASGVGLASRYRKRFTKRST